MPAWEWQSSGTFRAASDFDYQALVGGEQAVTSPGEPADIAEDVPDLEVSTAKMRPAHSRGRFA